MDKAKKIEAIKLWLDTGSINIFGKPFAGKDTHAKELAYELDAKLIGGGDIMRASSDPEIKSEIDDGKLAPTQKYLSIMLPYFSREEFSHYPLVLSSVGRWKGEEEGVLNATAQSGHTTKAVILINIDDDEIETRWRFSQHINDRGERADDNAHHKLEVRLNEFKEKTLPVIETYKAMGLIISVDGMQEKQKVADDIVDALFNLASKEP